MSARAQRALRTPRIDGTGPTGVFELLHGLCDDESSGACQVLRQLGVRPAELRRLVAYGTRHLEPEQLDELLDALDRRDTGHRPWWGPEPEAAMETMAFTDGQPLELARSESAVVTLERFARVARRARTAVLCGVVWALLVGVGSFYWADPELVAEMDAWRQFALSSLGAAISIGLAASLVAGLLRYVPSRPPHALAAFPPLQRSSR